MLQNKIIIRGARVNNLKNITVEIPKNKLVVITGLSGSGKSSLAFDTIFAEGQRRYVESLSSYARQFLELQDKPDVDEIKGLSPAIAIDQKGLSESPRSTVGTITEINDFLRLLFARCGTPKCLECGITLSRASAEDIVREIKSKMEKHPVRVLAPIARGAETDGDILKRLHKAGFNDARLKDKIVEVSIGVYGSKELYEDPEYVRLQILTALELGDGTVVAETTHNTECPAGHSVLCGKFFFSKDLTCPKCGKTRPTIEPRDFSFNSPHGACATCRGLGVKSIVVPELVLPNPRLSLEQGAIKPWMRLGASQSTRFELLQAVAQKHNFSLQRPISDFSKKVKDIVLYGTGEQTYEIKGVLLKFDGVIPEIESRFQQTDSEYMHKEIEAYMRTEICPDCRGARLNPKALSVMFAGKNIAEVSAMTIEKAITFFNPITQLPNYPITNQTISSPIIKEILERLNNLSSAGLGYLTIDRASPALSGGEGQRLRLATLISSPLSGVIYILDEPTIGLHERDTEMLLRLLRRLVSQGNTVIVVEHDCRLMREADWIIDMGPGAGAQGGQIIAQGTPAAILKHKNSLTGAYLSGRKRIGLPPPLSPPRAGGESGGSPPFSPCGGSPIGGQGGVRGGYGRKGNGKAIIIKGASAFNLINIDARLPLGLFICVSGVSGSGKSTLILEILAKALARDLHGAHDLPLAHKQITGTQYIDKVITVDQSPIGRTPRSNPATYTGIFSIIRDLYTEIPEAKVKGFDAGMFSFNVKGGRCETCAGEGYIKIPMQFMSETFTPCPECRGKRYRPEALEIHYQNKNIADVLDMSAGEAKNFFKDTPLLREKLQVLEDVGLGYIRLGQPATTLSGGEAQRVKLATELSRRATGRTLYILDEPTTGLHFEDINHLLVVLQRLVDKGNTVLVIEHNLEVLKCADWIIDMGPEGGEKGGYIVAQGTAKDICKVKRSYTGQYLKKIIKA